MATKAELQKRVAQLEAALAEVRADKERLALAVRGSNDGVWDWDIQNESLHWSPRLKEMVGYADDELDIDFDTFDSMLHPDDKKHVGAAIQAHLEDRAPYDVEQRLRTKSGEYRWFRARGQAIWDGDGNPVRMVGSTTDISGRKQAEEALRASEERFVLAMQATNDGIYDHDIVHDTIYWSPRLKELLGYADDELDIDLDTFGTFLHPDDREHVEAALEAHLKDRRPFDVEERLRTKSGEYRWFHARGQAVWDEDGQPIRIVGSSTDITERKQAEGALRTAYEKVERQIEERTAELQREVAERERAQAESLRLQEEVIEAQKRAIQELSTPIIPIMERIIVMPLIGSIDTMRARDVTRSLLAGIREHQAQVVIVDITGVPVVDSGVASYLNKTIQAARLKGARTIVTGISDAVAETIVDLAIDWSGIKTVGDLQTGLMVALNSLGIKLAR
jgi:PAS domain S-box-containing protein